MNIWSWIIFLCFWACPFFLEGASPIKVEVSAKGAILMNSETGAVLWEKNAHTPMYPASTTKMFTALYALEKKGHALDEMVTASSEAVYCVAPQIRRASNGQHPPYRLEFGGTHMGIKAGETLPLRTLLYGLMLNSGNDAANVIAQHVSGNISVFMEELNRFVRAKGCRNTILYTPHGLPHEEHKTTAYDMALLAKEALKNPTFREVVKATQFTRPETNKQLESTLFQHNALVKPGKFYYPKAIGIKTGYTISGGYTIVAAAEDTDRKLIAVLLGCEKIEQRYKDAIALFEAGFNEKKISRTLFSKGFDLFTYPIEGAKAPLQGYLSQDVILHYYPSEEPTFKTSIAWLVPELPILSGHKVGEMQILSSQGKMLTSAPIFAVKDVESTFGHQVHLVWKKIKMGLWNHVTWVMAALGGILIISTFYYSHRRSKFHRAK
jgi:serine-type D-Ala-D-Ala carboxypeptidase (penicillin-binding protein 5/6)